MGGGLLQIIANKSSETDFLLGNPEITFFKIVYRRHTNFAIESIEQKIIGDVNLSATQSVKYSTIISKEGDLCSEMYLEITLPTVDASSNIYVYGVGNALVKKVDIDIGGVIIDTHYSDWLNIWGELTVPKNKREGYDIMVGNRVDTNTLFTGGSNQRLYVPFRFWFNRNIGLALPLLALANNTVKLNFEFASYSELTKSGIISNSSLEFNIKLYIDYIYLDNDERRIFSQLTHEYLIEQIQFSNDVNIATSDAGGSSRNIDLPFQRPIKELVWVHHTNNPAITDIFNYSLNGSDVDDTFNNAKILVNGQDRFIERHASYFRLVQNFQHHTCVPRTKVYKVGINGDVNSNYALSYNQFIYVYSFALLPEEHQPSGHCNFSRLEKNTLQISYSTGTLPTYGQKLKIFAVNYNVLRIMSGSCSLIYSN